MRQTADRMESHNNKELSVSVLVPMFNEAKRLEYSIQKWEKSGLIKQIPFFLVDDGSSDNTYEIALERLSRFKNCTVMSFQHTSKYGAISRALKQIRTKYVLCIDADTWFSEQLEKYVEEFEMLDEKNADVVAFRLEPCHKKNTLLTKLQLAEYSYFTDVVRRLFGIVGNVNGAAALWKTQFLSDVLEKHSLIFEGDDLEATLIAHELGGKVLSSPLYFQKSAKPTYLELIRQRMNIWDVGLFGVFLRKPPINMPVNSDLLFFKWYAVFEGLLHPMKVLSFFCIIALFFQPEPSRGFLVTLSHIVVYCYIGATLICFLLWVRYFHLLKTKLRLLLILAIFSLYPTLHFFIKGGLFGSLVWWTSISFMYSIVILKTRIKKQAISISFLMPLYFMFMTVFVRTMGLLVWASNDSQTPRAVIKMNSEAGHSSVIQ